MLCVCCVLAYSEKLGERERVQEREREVHLQSTIHLRVTHRCYSSQLVIPLEMIEESAPYSHPADIWSLGMVIYALLEIREPYAETEKLMVPHSILSGKKPPISKDHPKELSSIVKIIEQVCHSSWCIAIYVYVCRV
jgi:serine/threonine protein kinase